MQRATAFKLLVVLLKLALNFSGRVSSPVTAGNQRSLTLLIKQGLGIDACDTVLKTAVLCRIRYALSMQYKYLTTDVMNKINAIVLEPRKWQLTETVYQTEDSTEETASTV
jgi:hypothetical protein